MMPARQAVQTAEDARLISLQKQEEAFEAEQRALAQQRETAALDRARAEEATRRLAEIERLNAETARVSAERDKAVAEAARRRRKPRYSRHGLPPRRSQRDKAAAEAARLAAEARRGSPSERRSSRARKGRASRSAAAAAQLDSRNTRNRPRPDRQYLRRVVRYRQRDVEAGHARETRKSRRYASFRSRDCSCKSRVTPTVSETRSYNQRLSENRAGSVRTYLVAQGIASTAVGTAGFGETQPVASNDTAAGRQQNRRVELVVAGEAIGTSGLTAQRN